VPGTVAASLALWSTTFFTADSPAWFVVVFHVLLSAGLAFIFTPLFTAGLGSVQPRFYSYGSAIFGTTQQLAGAAGVAALVSVMSVRAAGLAAEGAAPAEQTAGGVHAAFLVAAVLSLLAIVGAFLIRAPEDDGAPGGPHGGPAGVEPAPAGPATGAAAAVDGTADDSAAEGTAVDSTAVDSTAADGTAVDGKTVGSRAADAPAG
jgi:hypothetical protein